MAVGMAAAASLAAPASGTGRSSSILSRAGFGLSHKQGECSPSVQAFARRSDESRSSVATREPIPESRVLEAPDRPSRMPYKLITALSGAGALETAYLTWVKFSGSSAACPTGGPSCNDVLNSEYSTLFGFPLSLFGFVAYSSVALAALAVLQAEATESLEADVRWFLLGSTTAMATASGFFLYLLKYQLNGASCTYCFASAIISFSLCLSTVKGFKWKDLPKMAGLQIGVIAAVILTLSSAFAGTNSALAELDVLDLPPVEPEVTTTSDSTKISLAKHLKSIGAKMYGAFWCSHCHEQKQMLGQEATKILDYVECYPEGYGRYVRMEKACREAKVEGFPTWIIKGQSYPGELSLEDLAKVSGYTLPK